MLKTLKDLEGPHGEFGDTEQIVFSDVLRQAAIEQIKKWQKDAEKFKPKLVEGYWQYKEIKDAFDFNKLSLKIELFKEFFNIGDKDVV